MIRIARSRVLIPALLWAVLAVACGGAPRADEARRPATVEPVLATRSPARATPPFRAPTVNPTLPATPFAFRFDNGPCGFGTIDTFRGMFTLGPLWKQPKSVRLRLTERELGRIQRKMMEIRFFDYPRRFAIRVPEGDITQVVVPAESYDIVVRSGGRTKRLQWVDEITSHDSPEAERLRELFGLIERIVVSRPEVRRLPPPDAACH